MARMTYALEILSLGLSPAWSDYNILRSTILLDAKQATAPVLHSKPGVCLWLLHHNLLHFKVEKSPPSKGQNVRKKRMWKESVGSFSCKVSPRIHRPWSLWKSDKKEAEKINWRWEFGKSRLQVCLGLEFFQARSVSPNLKVDRNITPSVPESNRSDKRSFCSLVTSCRTI